MTRPLASSPLGCMEIVEDREDAIRRLIPGLPPRTMPPIQVLVMLWGLLVSTTLGAAAFGFLNPPSTSQRRSSCASHTSLQLHRGDDPNRRDFLNAIALATSLQIPIASNAIDFAQVDANDIAPPSASSDDTGSGYPTITQKVYMDVRISRSDGSFYVRDDLEDTPENRVFKGRLVFGLFGNASPFHVEQFLRYCTSGYDASTIDDPTPTYGKSIFNRYDDSTGLIEGGLIPSLELTEISGGSALKYRGRILPAKLWIESAGSEKVSHALGKGLLTHRTLDSLPTFAVTTRSTAALDSSHVVFGRILPSAESEEFVRILRDEVRTYSMDRPSNPNTSTSASERATAEVAGQIFAAQRDLFRGAAKSLGDDRVSKIYEGKLLRKVEVTQVGIL